MSASERHTTNALAIAGATCKSSAVVRYQQWFQLNVNNLAFVHNFGYSFSISIGTSRRISNALPSPMLHVTGNK